MGTQIVVAGALIVGRAVLVAQRRHPPELAGCWELPGGKVLPGEDESAALARELAEELGLDTRAIAVGARLGADVMLNAGVVLRAYRVGLYGGEPRACDHYELRWATADELGEIDWVPADRSWLAALRQALATDITAGR